MSRSSNIRHRLLIGLFLVIIVLFPYWQVSNFDFAHIDDELYVTNNSHIRAGITYNGTIRAFTVFEAANWHPLTWISHMLDCEIYGLNPMGHHWTSLQLHILNTLLLFIVLQQLTGALWRSAFAAALFGLHPLHVESVAWVSERKDVLSTFFGMLTILAYYRYAGQSRLINYILVLILFSFGLMAKPMLVTWPFLFLLLDIWPLKRLRPFTGLSSSDDTGRLQVKKLSVLIWEKIPFFLLTVVSCVLTYLAQQKGGAVGSFEVFSLKIRIANALTSYISYIYKAILPFKLAIFYPHPGSDVSFVTASFAAIVITGVSLLTIMVSRRYHYAAIGWFWYIGTLVPVIGLIQVGSQAMADRYTYIPLIGLFIIVSWGGYDLLRKYQWHKYFLGAFAGLILTALAVGTYFQTGYWKNSITVFEHAVNVTENNWLAHNNLGSALDREGRLEEALYHIKRALEISPENADALYNLGMALVKCGEKEKAIFYYRKSLEKDQDRIDSHLNLANLLAEQGKTEEAILHYRKVLRIDPENSDTHNNLAVLYDNLGEVKSVEFHYIRAINANPESVDANYNFGAFLLKQNRNKEAVSYIAKALAMIHTTDAHAVRPIYAKVFFDMGVELSLKGKFEEAIVFFKKALEIKPEHKEARKNLKILTEMLAQKE